MPKKSDLKFVALVAVGVMAAGYVMHLARDVSVVSDANKGFS